ncbi:MAG: 2-oxoacid:acceptor oxidoreductase subunit alpha [Thermodesulfovibrionales bacterium]
MDYSIKIGGEAGQGLQTIGDVLGKVFARTGYHVFSHQDYESRIRGGHNFYQIRASVEPVSAPAEKIDIVVALDRASIELHRGELAEDGMVLYDSESIKERRDGPEFVDVPLKGLAKEAGGSPVMANTVATGAVLGMLGMDTGILEALLAETFRKKGDEVVENNIKAARAGHGHAREHCPRCAFKPGKPSGGPKLLINGVEGVALGALLSGCKFYAAYPMTPSTGVLNFMAAHAADHGLVVEQAEDEIAAINMAIGASFAGARAMTGTSGGGFALMAEGLSLAGMTETPIVIAEGQRPGPATGFPTRTEQGDLLFLLHAGHGEFPRVLFAPGSPEQAVRLTNKAFELAEKYQVPAFVLFDQYLADTQWTYEALSADGLLYNDYRLRGEKFAAIKEYKRHAYTESGVSPLGVPGDAPHVVVTDSDEHGEEGHIVEDAETRVRMVEKRFLKKMEALKGEIGRPELYGPRDAETIVVGWGSTYGVLRETVDSLNRGGEKAAMLHFAEVFPFPAEGEHMEALGRARRTVCVENNASGQFERLVRAETGFTFSHSVRRYDGRPLTVQYISGRLHGGS